MVHLASVPSFLPLRLLSNQKKLTITASTCLKKYQFKMPNFVYPTDIKKVSIINNKPWIPNSLCKHCVDSLRLGPNKKDFFSNTKVHCIGGCHLIITITVSYLLKILQERTLQTVPNGGT